MENDYKQHEMEVIRFDEREIFCDLTTSGTDVDVQSKPGTCVDK